MFIALTQDNMAMSAAGISIPAVGIGAAVIKVVIAADIITGDEKNSPGWRFELVMTGV